MRLWQAVTLMGLGLATMTVAGCATSPPIYPCGDDRVPPGAACGRADLPAQAPATVIICNDVGMGISICL